MFLPFSRKKRRCVSDLASGEVDNGREVCEVGEMHFHKVGGLCKERSVLLLLLVTPGIKNLAFSLLECAQRALAEGLGHIIETIKK